MKTLLFTILLLLGAQVAIAQVPADFPPIRTEVLGATAPGYVFLTVSRDIDEVGYQSYRHWEFYPDIMRWERIDFDRGGDLGSALPLDEIAFIYYIRTLPLEVGKTYTLNRYFKEDGNPVKVTVLRKDQRETEGVLYNTIVVSPEIQTDGLFGQGGKGEIHFTDDERRIPVYVKSDIPNFPGSLTLHLRSITEGHPLNPGSREEAVAGRQQRAQIDTAGSSR